MTPPYSLLDLTDELLIQILVRLGLRSTVQLQTLRRLGDAYKLALTCRRLHGLFCGHIKSLSTVYSRQEFAPLVLAHPSHSVDNLRTLVPHLRSLKEVSFKDSTAQLVDVVHPDAPLHIVRLDSSFNCINIKKLPTVLRSLTLSLPSASTMKLLGADPPRLQLPFLNEANINGVPVKHLPKLRSFYRHFNKHLGFVHMSFRVTPSVSVQPAEGERKRELEIVQSFIRDVCENLTELLPKVISLVFSLWDDCKSFLSQGVGIEGFLPQIREAQALNTFKKVRHISTAPDAVFDIEKTLFMQKKSFPKEMKQDLDMFPEQFLIDDDDPEYILAGFNFSLLTAFGAGTESETKRYAFQMPGRLAHLELNTEAHTINEWMASVMPAIDMFTTVILSYAGETIMFPSAHRPHDKHLEVPNHSDFRIPNSAGPASALSDALLRLGSGESDEQSVNPTLDTINVFDRSIIDRFAFDPALQA